ncbi:MAG: AlbA family DNA-binding domain-containing protein, partial [Solirubrobacteraceae bacterium]
GDVRFEVEATVRLEAIISQGENATFEAKRELPGGDPDRVMKTVAAFANGGGGTIIFGVDNEMQIVGLGDALSRDAIDRVTSLISDRVHPHVVFDLEQVTLRAKEVLALNVHSGLDAPYGVGTNEQKLAFYVRRSGSTIPARPEDLRNSVLARVPSPPEERLPFQ